MNIDEIKTTVINFVAKQKPKLIDFIEKVKKSRKMQIITGSVAIIFCLFIGSCMLGSSGGSNNIYIAKNATFESIDKLRTLEQIVNECNTIRDVEWETYTAPNGVEHVSLSFYPVLNKDMSLAIGSYQPIAIFGKITILISSNPDDTIELFHCDISIDKKANDLLNDAYRVYKDEHGMLLAKVNLESYLKYEIGKSWEIKDCGFKILSNIAKNRIPYVR